MKTKILDSIDFEKVNILLEGFNKSTGFVTAILDLEGNVLSKSGWRQICTDFHRVNPEAGKKCRISDTVLANKMAVGEKYHFYKCMNGLVDVAVPVIIKGEHIANLFSGQFFFDKPDIDYFKKQASENGFDEQQYIEALLEVPVVSEDKVRTAMDFLLNMTQLISETTYQKFELQTAIEESNLAAEKIKDSNTLMRIAAEKAKLGGWNVDLKENRSYWSDVVAAIHEMPPGYSPLVEDGINFCAPEYRDRIIKIFTDCATNGVPYDEEMEIITSTGKRVWIRTIGEAVKDENGNIFKVEGAFQDISEKKIAEAKVREKDLQFRKLSANVPDLIFQFTRRPDGSYCVPVASEGIKYIFGCSPEDVVDDFTPIGKVIHPDDAERVIADIEYSASHLTYFTCEFRVVIPGRPVQWIFSRSTPEKLPDGSITWYGFNANITHRKEVEDEIRFLNASLEKRVTERTEQMEAVNRELEAFSYSVSHDLRAPLRHINGFAEILIRQYSDELSDDARKHLDTIIASAHKMGILIDDLLSFSRTGRAELNKTSLSMEKVVMDALTQFAQTINDRQIDLKISGLPEVNGDYNLLRLVWINLLDNAVKYTSTNKKAEISIGYKSKNNENVFLIKDNGVGFDMKYAGKLFGVFQRLHPTSQFEGTGIGLANVRRIIGRHGGNTWAEAEPDKGATFYFSLPKI